MSQQTTQTTQEKQTTWTLDLAHSRAEFSVRHMMITNVRGSIPIRSGSIRTPGDDPAGWSVEAELDAAGIATGVADRDTHLRSADFFDVENHPTMRFTSRLIEALDETRLRIAGDLTIRGTTREVVLDAERTEEIIDPSGSARVGIEATTTIERKEWDLNWNMALEAGGFLVGDKVKVALQLQAIRDG